MSITSSEIIKFYNSEIGIIAQNILQRHIQDLWHDTRNMRVMGCGYAMPYLNGFIDNSDRVISMISQKHCYNHWPSDHNNMVFLSNENKIPIESCSIDRILLIHYLEHCNNLQDSLHEIWRVLKSNGRLLVIVPNRTGMWSHAEWSPFGHGRPFTFSQLSANLRESMFISENHKGVLFVPPIPKSPILMKSANLIEKMGSNIFPFVAGAHMVEASKQIYATIDKTGGGSAVLATTKGIFTGRGHPIPQGFSTDKINRND